MSRISPRSRLGVFRIALHERERLRSDGERTMARERIAASTPRRLEAGLAARG